MPFTGNELAENKAWLRNQGMSVEMLYRGARRAMWYRPDGKGGYIPLGNPLPTDEYHMRRYRKRGWVLNPPAEVMADPEDIEEATVENHFHRFDKEIGSPCKFEGCLEVRTKMFGEIGAEHVGI
jgi:hypothetical protein